MIDVDLTEGVMTQLVVFYILVPLSILFAFVIVTRAVEGRDEDRDAGISLWYLAMVAPLAFIGFVALAIGNGYFIIMTAALAQSIPMIIGTFKYYELKAAIERRRRDAEIDDLCWRMESIESTLGIVLPYSPDRVRRR